MSQWRSSLLSREGVLAIVNYVPLLLFGVLRRTSDHTMDSLPESEIMQRWWAHMADIMETQPDNKPVVTPLRQVFHLP